MELTKIWGTVENISVGEISARAAAMFVLMIVMLRVSGMRSFGKGDVFDTILAILLGAVLTRGIVGATPFLSAIAAGVTILVIHNLLSRLSFYNKWIGRTVKGEAMLLYRRGEFIRENMKKADITKADIEEQLRVQLNTSTLDKVKEVYFERTGKVSFVKSAGRQS